MNAEMIMEYIMCGFMFLICGATIIGATIWLVWAIVSDIKDSKKGIYHHPFGCPVSKPGNCRSGGGLD